MTRTMMDENGEGGLQNHGLILAFLQSCDLYKDFQICPLRDVHPGSKRSMTR